MGFYWCSLGFRWLSLASVGLRWLPFALSKLSARCALHGFQHKKQNVGPDLPSNVEYDVRWLVVRQELHAANPAEQFLRAAGAPRVIF